MFPAAVRLLPIKDLKVLRFFLSAFFYRHAGPKGPEEGFFTGCVFAKSRAGSPDLDLFHRGGRRARTTEVGPMPSGIRPSSTAL